MNIVCYTIFFCIFIKIRGRSFEEEKHPNFWQLVAKLKEDNIENGTTKGITKSVKYTESTKYATDKITQFLKNKDIIKYFTYKKARGKNLTPMRSGRDKRSCFQSEDCGPGPGHVCVQNTCECSPSYIEHNATHCLPGVLLGFSCISHHQCRIKVPMSSCIQGYCRCGEGSVPYRRANCLEVSALGQSCRTHEQCSLVTEGSICKWIVKNVLGKCRCKLGMPRNEDKCESPGFALGAPCGKSYDCSQHVPGSICVSHDEVEEEDDSYSRNFQDSKKTWKDSHFRNSQDSQKSWNTFSSRDSTFNEVLEYSKEERTKGLLGGICKCPSGYFAIKNGTKCLPLKKDLGVSPVSLGKPCAFSSQCKDSDPFSFCNDGVCDCLQKNTKCSAKNTGCIKGTFQCISDGMCVSADYVCDGRRHCRDGSDEENCSPGTCSPLAFECQDGSCISRARICDGTNDCPDKSDEKRCHINQEGCPSKTFHCEDGECVPEFEFCNALPSCSDQSDENIKSCIGGMFRVPYCPFRCNNGRCRSLSVVCSGSDGCGDNSDEEICSVCNCPKPQ